MNDSSEAWMCTSSGRAFRPFAPAADDVSIEDVAHALAHICRFGGHTLRHYSVAQHSVLVADIVRRDLDDCSPLDELHALLHDAHKAYLGDVILPIGRRLAIGNGADGYQPWGVAKIHVQRAIETRVFGGHGIPAAAFQAIKRADVVALATERRDVMPVTSDRWPILDGVDPAAKTIRPLGPKGARSAFLRRFYDLFARVRS